MKAFLRAIFITIKELAPLWSGLIFPQRCVGCGIVDIGLCLSCSEKLGNMCIDGEMAIDGFQIFFAARHSELLRSVLHQCKYTSDQSLVETLGMLLVKRMRNISMACGSYDIVPIPLHRRRERERGFNQSELLARVVSREMGWRVVNLLERNRETKAQARLSRVERIENVKGAFVMKCELIPKVVFVLDDVITTGSTFRECARVLKEAGVERVYGIMLAHGL